MKKVISNEFGFQQKKLFSVEFPDCFGLNNCLVSKCKTSKYLHDKWANIVVEFADTVTPSVAQGLFKICDNKERESNDVLFTVILNRNDLTGEIVRKWDIKIKKIVCIDFGDLDTENDEIIRPRLSLQPYNVKLLF